MTDAATQLLVLLQVASPSWPSGAFSHSYGIETLIESGEVATGDDARRIAYDWLHYGVATADAAAVHHAMATASDERALGDLSETLSALKLTRELREASHRTGGAFLECALKIFGGTDLERYAAGVRDGRWSPHQPIAFAIVAASQGVDASDAVLAFLHASLANLVSVVGRIIPLGQVEVQQIISQAIPLLSELCARARQTPADGLHSATAHLDLASMRHERLYSRLCMS